MTAINATHDPARRSWVGSANDGGSPFPIQNLPFGTFVQGRGQRVGVGIGDQVLDLAAAHAMGLFSGPAAEAAGAASASLRVLMGCPSDAVSALRAQLSALLTLGPEASPSTGRAREALIPQAAVQMQVPCEIGDYTDFLTSVHHTSRHGRFKGLEPPLPPAFKSLPVAYHGRSSTIRVSGTPVRRPNGQSRSAAHGEVTFGPAEAMDFELELALFVGQGVPQGQPIAISAAPRHMFGYCLLNDWSAKSIQWWEQVLGPFLGKSFMTSVSPWVVTCEALAPFATPGALREPGDPVILPYLDGAGDRRAGGLAVELTAHLRTAAMRDAGLPGDCISKTDLRSMYWTFAQMLTHHASNGCELRPGDLMGSGTLSGATRESMACLTEMTEAGKQAIHLSNGESRRWLEDGDEIELCAWARKPGFRSIGFGVCTGEILPSAPWPRD